MRSFVYSSFGQRAISQLLFGTMVGSPGYMAAENRLFCWSNQFSFLLFLTYSYIFFKIREYENKDPYLNFYLVQSFVV